VAPLRLLAIIVAQATCSITASEIFQAGFDDEWHVCLVPQSISTSVRVRQHCWPPATAAAATTLPPSAIDSLGFGDLAAGFNHLEHAAHSVPGVSGRQCAVHLE